MTKKNILYFNEILKLPCCNKTISIRYVYIRMNRLSHQETTMTSRAVKFSLAFLYVILLCACNGAGGAIQNNGKVAGGLSRGNLVSSNLIKSMSSNEIQTKINTTQDLNITAVYDVSVYKLVYETVDWDGNAVNASGIVAMPQKNNLPSPLLSYQHGTIFLNCDAPSVLCRNDQYNERYFAIYYASQGYIVVAADYLGYGNTNNTIHPYHHAETLASATIDLLFAAKKYLLNNHIAFNNQLFLAGYSEGGYATLATQRTLEERYQGEFPITASAPGAGAYDMLGTAKALLDTNIHSPLKYPAYVAFVLKAYDTIYNWSAVSNIFRSSYENIVNTVFDGTNNGDAINRQLTTDIKQLFTAAFLADFNNSPVVPGTAAFLAEKALQENTIYNWIPRATTYLYHGVDDKTVPYTNALTVLDFMVRQNGANNVTLTNCNALPANHENCISPYFYWTMNTVFAPLAQDL